MEIGSLTLGEIWQEIEKKAHKHASAVENLDAVYEVNITGEETGTYTVILQNGTTSIKEGTTDKPDCVLTLGFKQFKKLLQGKLNAKAAVMTGKLKIKGNIGLALKLESILKQYGF
ncbi:MAG TPA: SCP2 sterol-binding domain-containing protein [Pseudogracilibacillus sp.]|nr:SCP2 sterol-binding domain-containing protein [Pseudogracilibacillus sp.]